jgi:hypothetical protein
MFRLLESASQVDLDSKVTDIPRSCVRGLLAKDISSLRSSRNLTASNFAYSLALKPLGKLSSKNGTRGVNYTHTSDNHSPLRNAKTSYMAPITSISSAALWLQEGGSLSVLTTDGLSVPQTVANLFECCNSHGDSSDTIAPCYHGFWRFSRHN